MTGWTLATYKTRNWAEYNHLLKQRGSLSIWFDAEMTWEAEACKTHSNNGPQKRLRHSAVVAE
jgi:hypothetical protein